MFELSWWCYVVSAVLTAAVLADARRRRLNRRSTALWAIATAITWVAVLPYAMTTRRVAA